MTIAERNKKLKHFITCLKCEVSGKLCDDNCSTQYDAGNMGEIIENLEAISKVIEQEPCEDAISRQAVLDLPRIKIHNEWGNVIKESVDVEDVRRLSPVVPQQKTGRWIMGKYKDTCNKCRCTYPKNIGFKNYCPNCGIKMEVEE